MGIASFVEYGIAIKKYIKKIPKKRTMMSYFFKISSNPTPASLGVGYFIINIPIKRTRGIPRGIATPEAPCNKKPYCARDDIASKTPEIIVIRPADLVPKLFSDNNIRMNAIPKHTAAAISAMVDIADFPMIIPLTI